VCGIPWCSARSFFGQDLIGDTKYKIMLAGYVAMQVPVLHMAYLRAILSSNTTLPT